MISQTAGRFTACIVGVRRSRDSLWGWWWVYFLPSGIYDGAKLLWSPPGLACEQSSAPSPILPRPPPLPLLMFWIVLRWTASCHLQWMATVSWCPISFVMDCRGSTAGGSAGEDSSLCHLPCFKGSQLRERDWLCGVNHGCLHLFAPSNKCQSFQANLVYIDFTIL
jgi:hypothetical protein